MNARLIGMALFLAAGGCVYDDVSARKGPAAGNLVGDTGDVESCIARYVDAQAAGHNGAFEMPFDGRTLRLSLVRVHTAFMPGLDAHSRSVCVDFNTAAGVLVDVDFALADGEGGLTVVKTAVHAVNGRPCYVWERGSAGFWRRLPVGLASEPQMGVIRQRDSFDLRYSARLPELAGPARLWLPLPETDAFQLITIQALSVPGSPRLIRDRVYGNRILFSELEPADSGKAVVLYYRVMRHEKESGEEAAPAPADCLAAESRIPVNGDFPAIARRIAGGRKTDMERAKALYDHVRERMRLADAGPGGRAGDAAYAYRSRAGNDADYHACFIALARSIGIPARFAAGVAIPSDRPEGGIDGVQAWAEFYADGKWHPVDVCEGDKYAFLASYYFGHLPANRFELSRGRDLVVDPLPASGPITLLADPVLEVNGRPVPLAAELSFRRSDVWLLVRRVMRSVGE